MTTVTNLLAQNVNILDTIPATGYAGQPISQLSSGEGAPGAVKIIEDVTAITTSFVSAAGNYARILRFPSNAKVKSVEIDPEHKILLDGSFADNSYVPQASPLPFVKWASNALFWLQMVLP